MPIEFACVCGKEFRVGEAFAGKRTKCPACGAGLTVPAATAAVAADSTPAKPESEDDAAYRVLVDGPDSEPAPPTSQAAATATSHFDRPASRPAMPAPMPSAQKPKFRKPSKEERKARKHRAARSHDPDRARKVLYVIGGVLMILGGVGLVLLSFGGGSVRGGITGGLLAFGGVGTFFQGVTGEFDDE